MNKSGITTDLSVLPRQQLTKASPIIRMLRTLAAITQKHRGFTALCDQGIISITNFATAMIIGRICGKPELGIYTLAWTLTSLITGISSTLIITPCFVFSPQLTRSRRRRYLGSIAMHQLFLAIAFAMLIGGGARLALWRGLATEHVVSTFAAVASIIMFVSLREFVRGVSFSQLNTGGAFVVDAIACTFQAFGIWQMVRFRGLSASRTFTLLGISSAIALCIWVILHRREFRFNSRLIISDLKRNWAFAKWVFGSAIVWQVATYLYPWMLAAFHGTSSAGDWAASAAVVAIGNPVLLGLSNYIVPKIANVYAAGGHLEMKRYINRSSLMFTALLSPLVLMLAIFGERLVVALYGNTFTGTSLVITFLAANMLVNAMVNPFAQGLFNLHRAKADMYINVVSVVFLFMIGVPAVKVYASVGAAAALLASSTLVAAMKIRLLTCEIRNRTATVTQTPPDLAFSRLRAR